LAHIVEARISPTVRSTQWPRLPPSKQSNRRAASRTLQPRSRIERTPAKIRIPPENPPNSATIPLPQPQDPPASSPKTQPRAQAADFVTKRGRSNYPGATFKLLKVSAILPPAERNHRRTQPRMYEKSPHSQWRGQAYSGDRNPHHRIPPGGSKSAIHTEIPASARIHPPPKATRKGPRCTTQTNNRADTIPT